MKLTITLSAALLGLSTVSVFATMPVCPTPTQFNAIGGDYDAYNGGYVVRIPNVLGPNGTAWAVVVDEIPAYKVSQAESWVNNNNFDYDANPVDETDGFDEEGNYSVTCTYNSWIISPYAQVPMYAVTPIPSNDLASLTKRVSLTRLAHK